MDTIQALIGKLKSPHWTDRAEAAEQLGNLGYSQAVKPLLKILEEDESPKVKREALLSLSGLGDARAFPYYINALKDEDPVIRKTAVKAAALSGDLRSLQLLTEALTDESLPVRQEAAAFLSRQGKQGVDHILPLLSHENPSVRWNVIKLLGESKDPRVFEPLIEALEDEELSIRRRAMESLLILKDPRAIDPILNILKSGGEECRRYAAELLGKWGDPGLFEPLAEAVMTGPRRTAASAAEALCRLGDEQAVKILHNALLQEKLDVENITAPLKTFDRAAVDYLLEEMGYREEKDRKKTAEILNALQEPLGEALDDFYSSVPESLENLLSMRDPRILLPIASSIKKGSIEAKKLSAELLRKIGSVKTLPLFTQLLEDEEPAVRLEGVKSISAAGNPGSAELLINHLKKETAPEIVDSIISILGETGSPAAIESLMTYYETLDNSPQKSNLMNAVESIASKTFSLKKIYKNCFCPLCLRRFTEHSVSFSFFKKVKYYCCRSCKGLKKIEEVNKIIALLDRNEDHFIKVEDDTVYVNWLKKKKPLDLDGVQIINADHRAIEVFIDMIEKDSKYRISSSKRLSLDIDKRQKLPAKLIKRLKALL